DERQAHRQASRATLLPAHPAGQPDCARAFSRRMEAGMGSGTALSRIAAPRVAATQPAHKTRTPAAQPRLVPGCARAATTKTGGRNVSGPALRLQAVN